MLESQEEMIVLSGIDRDQIRIYRVGFEFYQDYDDRDENQYEYQNLEHEEIGLVKPMIENLNEDPYTKRKIKPIPNKIRASCC